LHHIESWDQRMKISEDLYWYSKDKPVTSIFLRGFSANVFAIDQGDETWLIDTGTSLLNRPSRIVKWMLQDGLQPQRITKVFLTHAHPDHAGAVEVFAKKFGATVFIMEQEAAALAGGTSYLWAEEEAAARGMIADFYPAPMHLVKAFASYSMGNTPCIDNPNILKDNDVVHGTRHDLVALHAPGHVPGHACYYLPDIQAACIGDLIDPSFDRKASLNFPSSDFDQMYHSIERMESYDIEILCAAHAKQILYGKENNRVLLAGALEMMDLAKAITIDLLKRPRGMRLKEFAGHYPKKTWLLQDQVCVPFSIIKSLEKEGKIRFDDAKRFFYE